MNIDAMIQRRQRRNDESRLVLDFEPLSPIAYVDPPVDRTRLIELLLDHLDPVFDASLPPNGYLYGPKGTGKSTIVSSLYTHLGKRIGGRRTAIYTNTRVRPTRRLRFVYVDTLLTDSEFAFYRSLLKPLAGEPIPEHGVSTEVLGDRLHRAVEDSAAGLVLAVDHVGEPGGVDTPTLVEWFEALPSSVSWLAIGRATPAETELTDYTAESIRVDPYRRHVLVNVLLRRAASGLDRPALGYEAVQRIADWADGDAHDGLAALFIAAHRADDAGRSTVSTGDIDAAIAEIPDRSVSLARVLALPANKQSVLRAFVDLEPADRGSVTDTTAAIADAPTVDLATGTIQRYLYEMAEDGIIDRVRGTNDTDQGRPPSRLEPRFPATAFRRLYEFSG